MGLILEARSPFFLQGLKNSPHRSWMFTLLPLSESWQPCADVRVRWTKTVEGIAWSDKPDSSTFK